VEQIEQTDKEVYNKFIQTLELADVFLGDLVLKKKTDPLGGSLSFNLSPNFTLTERTEDQLTATAEFNLDVKDGNDIEVFTINAKFTLKYTFSKDVEINKEVEERFLKSNVPLNSWPYGRELISSLTTRMGYPSLVIGTFKVF